MKKKILLFILFSNLSADTFTPTNNDPIYAGFGGYTTNCNTKDCCASIQDPLESAKCYANVQAAEIITIAQTSKFIYSASLVGKLQNLLSQLDAQRVQYCCDLGGIECCQQGESCTNVCTEKNTPPTSCIQPGTEMACSPKGIIEYFTNNFFLPTSPLYSSTVLSTLAEPVMQNTYFGICPGSFIYLCNLMGYDNCTSASSPFAIDLTNQPGPVATQFEDPNGNTPSKVSFYDYIKVAINSEGTFAEAFFSNLQYPPYYDWYQGQFGNINLPKDFPAASEFMKEYYKRIILPYIKIAQYGQNYATGQNGSEFAGFTTNIIRPCTSASDTYCGGDVWDSLDPKLQEKITSDFPKNRFSPGGISLCFCLVNPGEQCCTSSSKCGNGINYFGCYGSSALAPLGMAIVYGAASNLPGSLTCNILLQANESIPEGLYYKLLDCCCQQGSQSTSPACKIMLEKNPQGMSPAGAAFLCSLTSNQYDILNQVLKHQSAQFSLDSLMGQLGNNISQYCSKSENSTVSTCLKNAHSANLSYCVSQGKCHPSCLPIQGATGWENPQSCPGSQLDPNNDISPDCIKCISDQGLSLCDTDAVKDAIKSCTHKLFESTGVIRDMTNITDSLTAMALSQLQYANLIRHFSLFPGDLPEFTTSCKDPSKPANCLVDACYPDKNNCILKYKKLVGWDDVKDKYNDAAKFLAQAAADIFGTCPKHVTVEQVFMEIMMVLGPVLGIAFTVSTIFSGGAFAIVMMAAMFLASEGMSIGQQIVQAQAQSAIAALSLEQQMDTTNV